MSHVIAAVIACDKREAFTQGSEATKQSRFISAKRFWIASLSFAMTETIDALRTGRERIERLNRFSRVWHRGGEAAIDRERLAVDIGRLVAGEEQSHRRDLV